MIGRKRGKTCSKGNLIALVRVLEKVVIKSLEVILLRDDITEWVIVTMLLIEVFLFKSGHEPTK